jgi:hypothetical protein
MLMGLKEELRACQVSDKIYHATLTEESGRIQALHADIVSFSAFEFRLILVVSVQARTRVDYLPASGCTCRYCELISL